MRILPVVAVALLAAASQGARDVVSLEGNQEPDVVSSAGLDQTGLVPMLSVYEEAKAASQRADVKADLLKSHVDTKGTATVTDMESKIEASLAGGDGAAAAQEASKRAKAAVDGVAAAKKALENAGSMLEKAEQEAQQSQADAESSAAQDEADMTGVVNAAVKAAQTAESAKVEALKTQRMKDLVKQDLAYKNAMDALTKKRDDAIRLGETELRDNTDELHRLEAEGPSSITKSIAARIQRTASPQKLTELSSDLLTTMGQKAIKSQKIAAMADSVQTLGEALPSKMSQDESVFNNVLNEMKNAEHSFKPVPTTVKDVQPVDTEALKQLASKQTSVAQSIHSMEVRP